ASPAWAGSPRWWWKTCQLSPGRGGDEVPGVPLALRCAYDRRPATLSAKSSMRNLPDPEKAKPCVLVVDDDEAVAWAIAGRLGQDCRVVCRTDPAGAVARAREERPGVILCDINMPGMPGDDVAFALSQDPATAPIPLI